MTRRMKIGDAWCVYDSKSSNEKQIRPRLERSCAKNVCVWNGIDDALVCISSYHYCWNRSNKGMFGTGTFGTGMLPRKNTIRNQKTELDIPGKESVKYGMSMYSGDENYRCENDICMFMTFECHVTFSSEWSEDHYVSKVSVVDDPSSRTRDNVVYHPSRWPATGCSDSIFSRFRQLTKKLSNDSEPIVCMLYQGISNSLGWPLQE